MSKFLIIDDNEDKYIQIQSVLIESGIRGVAIDWAKSKKSALTLLRVERYLVVLLDLNLPEFDGKKPIENGGFEVLEKINKNKTRYKVPHHIICLSAYKNIREEQSQKFLNLDLSIHDFEFDTWKTALKNKLDWGLDVVNAKDNERQSENILSITVHGIRTQGKWQNQLDEALRSECPTIVCKNYKYNYFSAIKLLILFFPKKGN